jgi:hypothetical protein
MGLWGQIKDLEVGLVNSVLVINVTCDTASFTPLL